METKEQLVNNIREWIKMDEEMKALQVEVKKRREKKKELTDLLVNVMKEHEIDCFDVNNGKLVYTKNRIKSPLSKKTLLAALQKYYDNEDEAEKMTEYLLDSRSEKIKEHIRRRPEK